MENHDAQTDTVKTEGSTQPEPAKTHATPPDPPEQADQSGEKEKLINELVEIAKHRNAQNNILPEFKDRIGDVLHELTQVHGVTFTVLEQLTGVTRQNLSKILKKHQKEHFEPGEQFGKAANLADKGVKKTLEADLSKRASDITSAYLNLGKSLFDKFESKAIQQGFTIQTLAETAVSSYLSYGDLYAAALKTEQENIELRKYINEIDTAAIELLNRNKNLKRAILNINSMR